MDRDEALKVLAAKRGDSVVVTAWTPVRTWFAISHNPLDVMRIPSMGQHPPFALGLALALPGRKVLLIDGDGGLLHNLGCMVTIAAQEPRNFYHFVMENGTYEMTGNQPIPGVGKVSFAKLALAAGYRNAYEFEDLGTFQEAFEGILAEEGPVLVDLKVQPGVPYTLLDDSRPRPDPLPVIRAFQEAAGVPLLD